MNDNAEKHVIDAKLPPKQPFQRLGSSCNAKKSKLPQRLIAFAVLSRTIDSPSLSALHYCSEKLPI